MNDLEVFKTRLCWIWQNIQENCGKFLKKMKKVVTITNVICYNELYWNFCSLKDTTI